MPTYEYRCDNGHQFEVVQRMSDDALTACEVCESRVQRVFHPVAVHFKGSGFYNTDYGTRRRSREAAESESSDSKGSENGSKTDDKKTEAAPKADSGKSESPKKSAATAD
jgi:putative FmdB family regulatory protein